MAYDSILMLTKSDREGFRCWIENTFEGGIGECARKLAEPKIPNPYAASKPSENERRVLMRTISEGKTSRPSISRLHFGRIAKAAGMSIDDALARLQRFQAEAREKEVHNNTVPPLKTDGEGNSVALPKIFWAPWHVTGLIPEAISSLRQMLQTSGIVEIVGPPGSGKSAMITELLNDLDEACLELNGIQATSRSDLVLEVYKELRGKPPLGMREGAMFEALAGDSTIVWLRNCDHVAIPALQDFLDSLVGIAGMKTRWIVETTTAVSTKSRQCGLSRLDGAALSKILAGIYPGGYFSDPEHVIQLANGNPRRAVTLWRSRNQAEAEAPNTIDWFQRQLSREEELIFPVLCHAVANSPLGVTVGLIQRWAQMLFPDRPPSSLDSATMSLVDKLEDQQMARVCHFSRESFPQGPTDLLPESLDITTIDFVDTALRASVSLEPIIKRMSPAQEALHSVLIESNERDSIGFVAAALVRGDLEPFLRSSFAWSLLEVVLEWFDRADRIPTDRTQAYLLRCLRFISQIGHRPELSVEHELKLVGEHDSRTLYAFAVARARYEATRPIPANLNVNQAIRMHHAETDPELRVELLGSLAQSLLRAERIAEAWEILRDLPSLSPPNTVAHYVAHRRRLEFLNRRKQRLLVVHDAEALSLIAVSAREVIRYATRVENLPGICDALFYSVRAQELIEGTLSDEDVEFYGAALNFIEESRTFRQRRLQILLTHGSLHRHACRREGISWDDFHRHMDAAFVWYTRAIRSAIAQNHLQHTLNALCYMTDLCVRTMRFPSAGLAPVTAGIERSREVCEFGKIAQIDSVQAETKEEQTLLQTLRDTAPILLYLQALSEHSPIPNISDGLLKSWSELVLGVKAYYAKAAPNQRLKYANTFWKRIERLIRVGELHNPARNREVLRYIQPLLMESLEATRPLSSTDKRSWDKVCALVQECSKPITT